MKAQWVRVRRKVKNHWFTPSGPCFSRLDNHTFSPATSPYHTSFPTPGIPGECWLGNPTWKCWATPCRAQCSCLCSWTPGCWNATVEWSLNVLLTSPRFAFCAAFFSLPTTALLLSSSYKHSHHIRMYLHLVFVVCYLRAILRLCAFLMRRQFRVFSERESQATLFISAALQTLSHNANQSFSQLCVIFMYFFCVCSISRSSWQIATTSASLLSSYKSLANHYYSTAPSFNLLFLHYTLRVSSREPIHASFSKGGILI